jgi:hypothetical protein
MRRLLLLLAIPALLLAAAGVFDWWVDPFGQVYKPAALTQAADDGCLLSEELIGNMYWDFKLDVFHRRPTRTIVVGSSRVLKIQSHPGEQTFANMGWPGTAPQTVLALFNALPAKPALTVYVGVEVFWFNKNGYAVPPDRLSWYQRAQYVLSRNTFRHAVELVRKADYVLLHRWRRAQVGTRCVIGRIQPGFAWKLDGSRVWGWELDPSLPHFYPTHFTGAIPTLRNGYYTDFRDLDPQRLRELGRALALAHARGWTVVGFAPPEPPFYLRLLETNDQLAPVWRAFLATMPRLFRVNGAKWISLENGRADGCRPSDFPDAWHSDASCSAKLRDRLDQAAG